MAETRAGGPVAVIELDNPPVNGLSHHLRKSLVAALEAARADGSVRAIVLIGKGRVFCGGADIREFNTPNAVAEPTTRQLIELIEAFPKPVIAAVHGVAMGGGLEVALGCHYRVAAPGSQIALPEVNLGILPGAGGTQRLPRVIGVENAAGVILSGKPVVSDLLAPLGLFSRIIEDDLRAGAIAFALALPEQAPLPRVRDAAARVDHAGDFFAGLRAKTAATQRGYDAPMACIDCLEAAVTMPFDDGLTYERARFDKLVVSPQSKALRYAFFAERACGKVAGVGKEISPRPVNEVALLGCSGDGLRLAAMILNAGLPVTVIEQDEEELAACLPKCRAMIVANAKAGGRRLNDAVLDKRMAKLALSTAFNADNGFDLIIEAAVADAEGKLAVLSVVAALAQAGALLAPSSPDLDLSAAGAACRRPGDLLGLHAPGGTGAAHCIEIRRGGGTLPNAIAAALALASRLGRTGIVTAGESYAVGERMMSRLRHEAARLRADGVSPKRIADVLESWGMAPGALEASDDVPNSAAFAGGDTSDEDIVARCVYGIVDEAAQILGDGAVIRASDIDVMMLAGYGFPRYRGGPLFHADAVGLDSVVAALTRFGRKPAPLLAELAAKGKRISDQ